MSMYSSGTCNVKLSLEDTLSVVHLCHLLITQLLGFKLMMLGYQIPQRTTCCMLYAFATGPYCHMHFLHAATTMLVEDDAQGQHSASHI